MEEWLKSAKNTAKEAIKEAKEAFKRAASAGTSVDSVKLGSQSCMPTTPLSRNDFLWQWNWGAWDRIPPV
jgi:hypothetical protein